LHSVQAAGELSASECDRWFDAAMAHPVLADRFNSYLEKTNDDPLLDLWLEIRDYRQIGYAWCMYRNRMGDWG